MRVLRLLVVVQPSIGGEEDAVGSVVSHHQDLSPHQVKQGRNSILYHDLQRFINAALKLVTKQVF